jgi:capsular exopolysaccharide synthesis family protein
MVVPAMPPASFGPIEHKQLTLKDLWGTFSRRKLIMLTVPVLCVAAAVVVLLLSTKRYEATGQLQVQKEGSDALGLGNMMGGADTPTDALDANITIQTQAQILQSEGLALRVIKDLDLEHNSDFRPHFQFNPIGWVLSFLSPPTKADPKNASLEDSPQRRTRVMTIFEKKLKVKPLPGTRVIEVSYLNPDPVTAAAVVNHLIDGLADFNFQTRYKSTLQTAGWLGGQMSDLRRQSEESQAKVVELQHLSGIFTLGETDAQGHEQLYTPVMERLQQANTQLAQAQANRILKGAVYEVVKTGDPEAISGLGSGTMNGLSAGTGNNNTLLLLQNLRNQEATAQAQVNELSAKFGPGYPKLDETRASLAGIQSSIHAEVARLADRAKNDYEVAQQVEDRARNSFLDEKKQADALNDKAVEYTIAKQEAEENRNLYDNLLKKLKEAGVLAGLHSSNISLVDAARVPAKPSKPNPLLYLGISVVGGIFLGSCCAIFRDVTDNKIHSIPDLEAHLGQAPLGVLPHHRAGRIRLKNAKPARAFPASSRGAGNELPAIDEPRSSFTESMRSLRTTLTHPRSGAPPKVILVTSSESGEGKSTVSLNLAALLAQQHQGGRVLLVDGDLRDPVLHKRLKMNPESGLSTILTGQISPTDAKCVTIPVAGVPGLDFLPAGPAPLYPAEIIGSKQMRQLALEWRRNYDMVVIDGAPLLPVTDSVLLSTIADLSIVVARHKVTELHSLERAYRLLEAQNEPSQIGLVVNGVERSSQSYDRYYGSRSSAYYVRANHA